MIKTEAVAYNETLADQVERVLQANDVDYTPKKMFGGLAFMVRDQMAVGVTRDWLMVRVPADEYENSLTRYGARPMDFTGRVMKNFVFVEEAGYSDWKDLQSWVAMGVRYAMENEPKIKSTKPVKKK
ncbi:MAG: hypothetical protein RL220_251 [Bacteroidota bacterium]